MYCDDTTRVFCINTKNNNTPIYKNMQILLWGIRNNTVFLKKIKLDIQSKEKTNDFFLFLSN